MPRELRTVARHALANRDNGVNEKDALLEVGPPAHTAAPSRPRHDDGPKETIESIIVALILAFVFRAFVVEAFVIPTGSMAPTLYGAHGTILCEKCGSEFAYGLRDPDDKRRGSDVSDQAEARCPNCDHVNTNLQTNDRAGNPERGDRILVLKWPFDLGFHALDPARWDVIVFKDPSDGVTNFIKRCAGISNEVLMILDGDVYTAPTSSLSPEARSDLEEYTQKKFEFLQGTRRGRLEPPSARAFDELDKKLRICRKTRAAQDSLWHVAYDNDHPPRNPVAGQPHWMPARGGESGWDTSDYQLRFSDRGTPLDFIELQHKEIRASCAYNINSGYAPTSPFVSDQRIRFVYTPGDGDPMIRVRLMKRGRSYWAELRMDGTVKLYESPLLPGDSTPAMASAQIPPLTPGKSVEFAFENLDYRLAISFAGREILSSSSNLDSPAYYGPDVHSLRISRRDAPNANPRIFGVGGSFELSHLIVERDEHYFTDPRMASLPLLDWAPREGWGGPDSPILLRADEFFMLGDNTSASKDSRLWDVAGPHLRERGNQFQLGTVPRDQLIGRAFFVYWPSGNRLDWAPLLNKFGIIPDVGRMRWIR
ncbi:MAG: hypothetical protein HY287_07885 [Planctomycetes bacterium]|nr:hypothetical protein [Planctomycetota bacterium]